MTRSEVTGAYRSMIDNLSALRAYVAVIEAGSFSEAGYRLNVMPSTISKHVSLLEEKFQGQLIIRSTKSLSVTELGHRFYERCLAILGEVEETEADLLAYQMEPQGKLRITAGPSLAETFFPSILPEFLARYPKINLELRVSPEVLDMIENSIDVGIRISSHLDPGLIAVKLAPNLRTICAAPAYLEKHGAPQQPADLAKHNCLLTSEAMSYAKWPLAATNGGGVDEVVQVSGNLIVNHGALYRSAVIDGMGVGYLSRYLVRKEIDRGELVELFPDRRVANSNIYIVYPQRRNLPLKTRAFIDFVREAFRKMTGLLG